MPRSAGNPSEPGHAARPPNGDADAGAALADASATLSYPIPKLLASPLPLVLGSARMPVSLLAKVNTAGGREAPCRRPAAPGILRDPQTLAGLVAAVAD